MVAAVSVVGSTLVDSKNSPCLCIDASLPSCILISGDSHVQRHHNSNNKHVRRVKLSTSFLDHQFMTKVLSLGANKKFTRQRKMRNNPVIVDELAGHYEDNFEDVKRQLIDYFTYKAVRTVLNQLYELNPTQYRWFYNFVASNEHGYGKRFISDLGKEKHELAERVMITRLHLYGRWIKRCDHTEMYERISDQNLELMRERLMETVVWPTDETDS